MTVSSETTRNAYTAQAAQVEFQYTFRVLADAHLAVYVDGVLQTLTTHYTVSGVGDAGGGNVTFGTAPGVGKVVTILRDVTRTQETDYVEAEKFPAATHENALDKLTMIAQQTWEELGRALVLTPGSTYTGLTVPNPVANNYLRWKNDLTGLENASLTGSGTIGLPVAIADGGTNSADADTGLTNLNGISRKIVNAKGDIIAATDADTVARKAVGANRTVLRADSTKSDGLDYVQPNTFAGNSWRALNLTGLNNAGTPNTQYDLAAAAVILRDTNNEAVIRWAPGTLTCNIATAGPAANGRDQAGAFGAASWVHFYWIWDGTTLATLASITATPMSGPTALPTGYTHWCYAGSVYYNATPLLVPTRLRGHDAFYETRQAAPSIPLALEVETAVALTALVPAVALAVRLEAEADLASAGGGSGEATVTLRVVTGADARKLHVQAAAASQNAFNTTEYLFPNISQQVFYLWNAGTGSITSKGLNLYVVGYTLP